MAEEGNSEISYNIKQNDKSANNKMLEGKYYDTMQEALHKAHFSLEPELIGNIGVEPEPERFTYGEVREDFFLEGEDIHNLTIDGQDSDKIIEYEAFGKTWYFWYYNDLKSEKKLEIRLKMRIQKEENEAAIFYLIHKKFLGIIKK